MHTNSNLQQYISGSFITSPTRWAKITSSSIRCGTVLVQARYTMLHTLVCSLLFGEVLFALLDVGLNCVFSGLPSGMGKLGNKTTKDSFICCYYYFKNELTLKLMSLIYTNTHCTVWSTASTRLYLLHVCRWTERPAPSAGFHRWSGPTGRSLMVICLRMALAINDEKSSKLGNETKKSIAK